MNSNNILNTKVSIMISATGLDQQGNKKISTCTLLQAIELGNKWKEQIQQLQSFGYGSDKYKQCKKMFPCYTPCGVFDGMKDSGILSYSNIIALDIDKHDNNIDLNKIRKQIYKLPYVISVLKSISGQGLYALVYVEDGQYTKEYYKYLAELWNQEYGLNIDTQCTNISRKRFISYDDESTNYIKYDAEITPWKLYDISEDDILEYSGIPNLFEYKRVSTTTDTTLLEKTIEYLCNHGFSIDDFNTTKPRATWYYVGCDFSMLPNGRRYFELFSSNSSKYHDNLTTINKKFDECEKAIKTISIDELCRKYYGIAKSKYGKDWIKIINKVVRFES